MSLDEHFYFVHVVEKGGFSAAARALGIPKSRISRNIRLLEERLGVRLIQRTSRQFNVTHHGMELYKHAKIGVEELVAAEAAALNLVGAVSGRVRFSCSVGLARFAVQNAVIEFMQMHPQVELVEHVTNRQVDVIEEGIDFAIRAHSSPLPDSDLIQKKVIDVQWGFYASPNLVERIGVPSGPDAIEGASALVVGTSSQIKTWSLSKSDGEPISVQVVPRLWSDDMGTLRQAAIDGHGITALPTYICAKAVADGSLVRLLPDWHTNRATLSLITPSRKGALPAVKAFADHIAKALISAVCEEY